MYTIEEITSTYTDEFSHLFEDSYSEITDKNYDWGIISFPTGNYEERLECFRRLGQDCLDGPDGRGFLWKKDGVPIQVAVGQISSEDPTRMVFIISLYGRDANGSKSWLYDKAYYEATINFYKNVMGFSSDEIHCKRYGPIWNLQIGTDIVQDYTVEIKARPIREEPLIFDDYHLPFMDSDGREKALSGAYVKIIHYWGLDSA